MSLTNSFLTQRLGDAKTQRRQAEFFTTELTGNTEIYLNVKEDVHDVL